MGKCDDVNILLRDRFYRLRILRQKSDPFSVIDKQKIKFLTETIININNLMILQNFILNLI